MQNMELYNAWREVPENAKRPITAGRLKGKTDINPMWRIRVLTERFGPCGIGWGYTIDKLWIEDGTGGERTANVMIGLWYRAENGEKSDPIPAIGGSALVARETKGLYTSDECYKMALTDAISVAAKALGVGADVYWEADATKYRKNDAPQEITPPPPPPPVQSWNALADITTFCAANNLKMADFGAMRNAAVAGGIVQDIPSSKLSREECAALLRAIKANFLPAKPAQ